MIAKRLYRESRRRLRKQKSMLKNNIDDRRLSPLNEQQRKCQMTSPQIRNLLTFTLDRPGTTPTSYVLGSLCTNVNWWFQRYWWRPLPKAMSQLTVCTRTPPTRITTNCVFRVLATSWTLLSCYTHTHTHTHTPRNVSNSHKQTWDGILAVGDYYVDKEQLASKLSEMQKVGMCDGVKEILGSDCPELMVIKRSRQQPVVSLDEVPIPPSAPHFEPTTPPQQTSKQPPLRRSAAFGSQELESSSDSCNQGILSKRYQGTSRQDFLIIADQYSKNHKLNLTNQLGLSPRPSAMSRPRVPVKQTTKIGTHILKKSTTSTTISTLYISNSATVSNKGMSSADTLSTKRGNTEQGNTERGNTEQGNTERGNTEQGNTELTSRIRPLSRSTSEQSEQQRREHMMAPGGGTRRRCYSTSNLPNLRTTDVTRSRPSTTDNTASRPNSRAIATVEEHPYCKEKPLDIRFLKWALDGAVTELPPSYSKNRTRVYFAWLCQQM